MAARLPRFQKGQALSHRDLNAISEAISEQERGEFQRARRRRPADFLCKIVAFGPRGPEVDDDFPDSRYWVRQVRLQATNAIPIGMEEIAFGTSTPVWAEAINLSEAIIGTHSVPHDTIVRIFEIRDWGGQTHFVFTNSASAAPSSSHREVVINGVFELWTDCVNDPDCSDGFNDDESAFFPHLGCNPVLANGDVDQDTYLKVHPNWGHTLSEFAPVSWDVTSINQPTFSVLQGARGLTMTFGQGEKWTTPPTNLCGTTDGSTGACCESDGTCTDNTTQGDCESGGGSYVGNGTSCGLLAGGCAGDPIGACCCPVGSACYNPAVGGPVTCSANVIEAQCATDGGTWQGAFTTCVGSPCSGGVNGACCLPGGTCILADDDVDCGLQGGTWLGDPSCEPNPCGGQQGACCLISGACLADQSSPDCNLQGGIYQGDGTACGSCGQPEACCIGTICVEWPVAFCNNAGGTPMGGTCAPDPCGGGAQQPTGRQAGRSV
ncbi:MAG: hypothetical protein IID41_03060 [Planctomycetes bacterium]|nr:hypothetical protein [Planctomycetota bacterium]